jgi:hypothetical protein
MNLDSPWFRLAIAILACWRVTRLVTRENGPWHVIARLRTRAGASVFGELMDCPYCTSVWVAMPATLVVVPSPMQTPTAWVTAWLAISGATCLLFDLRPAPYAAAAVAEEIDDVQL